MDDAKENPVIVTILDTVTGQARKCPPDPPEWQEGWGSRWWSEGNGACDCNRRLVFSIHTVSDDHECRSERYRIVAVEPMPAGYELADFNRGYPPAAPVG